MLGALHRHWFAPASLGDLAVVRIVAVGGYLLLYTPRFPVRRLAADPSTFVPLPALKVLLLPFGGWGIRPDPMFLKLVVAAALVSGVLALIGLYTRPSMFVFAATTTLLAAHQYSYQELHHPKGIMIISLWVLAFSPVAATCSVDDFRHRLRASMLFNRFRPRSPAELQSQFARWPLRVIQWTFVLIYFSAAMSKLRNGGLEWMNGHTLAYYLVQDGTRNDLSFALWLSDQIFLTSLMSVVTLFFEATFFAAILMPPLTWIYIGIGTALHLGIYILQNARFFSFILMYVVFIDELRHGIPPWLRTRMHARFQRQSGETTPWTVLYDGTCRNCIRMMVFIDYVAPAGRLRYLELENDRGEARNLAPTPPGREARETLQATGPHGRTYTGYWAFRKLAHVLRPLWILLPLLHAPFAERVGPKLFRRMVGGRTR